MTCPWPEEYSEILDYQWNDVLIPFWKKQAEEAQSWGVDKIALELHPGFCVYNTRTMLRLRQEDNRSKSGPEPFNLAGNGSGTLYP